MFRKFLRKTKNAKSDKLLFSLKFSKNKILMIFNKIHYYYYCHPHTSVLKTYNIVWVRLWITNKLKFIQASLENSYICLMLVMHIHTHIIILCYNTFWYVFLLTYYTKTISADFNLVCYMWKHFINYMYYEAEENV